MTDTDQAIAEKKLQKAIYRRDHKAEIKAYNANYYLENREKEIARSIKYQQDNKGIVTIKKAEYHQKNKKRLNAITSKYYKDHKDQIATRKAKYIEENGIKIKDYYAAQYVKHREYILLRNKNDRAKNPEKYRAIIKKRMENPKYKLSSRMSCNMRNSLKQKSKAGRHWETLVDFSLEQLEKRLRRTMPNGYTWQDFIDGKLHIDHKIPIAVFNYQTPDDLDFKKCWTLKNLQLLPVKENLIKSAKIDKPFQPSLLLSKRRTMLAEKISLHGI